MTDWMDLAACKGMDPDMFFPPKGAPGTSGLKKTHPAYRVCAGCPVKAECLEYALEHGEKYGIWGGTAERERRKMRRRRRQEAA